MQERKVSGRDTPDPEYNCSCNYAEELGTFSCSNSYLFGSFIVLKKSRRVRV